MIARGGDVIKNGTRDGEDLLKHATPKKSPSNLGRELSGKEYSRDWRVGRPNLKLGWVGFFSAVCFDNLKERGVLEMMTPASGSGWVTPARPIVIDLDTPPYSGWVTPSYKGGSDAAEVWTPAYNGSASGSVSSGSWTVGNGATAGGVDAGLLSDKLFAYVQPLDISKLPSWGCAVPRDYSTLPRDVWRLFLDWVWNTGAEHDVFTIRRLCGVCKRHVDEYSPVWQSFRVPQAAGLSLSVSVIRHCADVQRERLLQERRNITAAANSIKLKISRRDMKIQQLKGEKRGLEVELETNQDQKTDIDARLSEIKTAFKFKRARRTVKK